MEAFDLSPVDQILVGGTWIPIKKGSLEQAAGIALRVSGEIVPVHSFRHRSTGAEGIVVSAAIVGWSPVKTKPDEPTLVPEAYAHAGTFINGSPAAGLDLPRAERHIVSA